MSLKSGAKGTLIQYKYPRLMKTALHRLALRMGWYKDITGGLPLNICKTVFGVYFFEGVYTARPIGELVEELYSWGWSDGEKACPCLPLSQTPRGWPTEQEEMVFFYDLELPTEQEEQAEMVFSA